MSTKTLDKQINLCYNYLINAKNLVISSHIHPDGDAVGSALALYFYSIHKGINTKIFFHSKLPYNLKFLNGVEYINQYDEQKHREEVLDADTIFVIDLNDSSRLGSIDNAIINSHAKKIVVDHHLNPREFADFYLVDSESSSTGELVFKILKKDKDLIITKDIADALYTAIMTDTGSFRFPRSTSDVHRIVAELIDCGADPVEIYDNYYNIIPSNAARLLGLALSGMELFFDGKFCLMTLTGDNFIETNSTVQDVEGIVEKTVTIRDVKVGVLITENPDNGDIKLSFRSKGDLDIRTIAAKFGGGGHQQAAGAKLSGAILSDVRNKIIEEISELLG